MLLSADRLRRWLVLLLLRMWSSCLDWCRGLRISLSCQDVAVCLQAEAAKAAELRGPHTFSLSRLLTIYSSLLAADENHSNYNSTGSGSSGSRPWQQRQQHQGGGLMASAGWMGVHRSDVLMGVNTLVASRLMSQVSRCMLLVRVRSRV
jgi:hypothetical protein